MKRLKVEEVLCDDIDFDIEGKSLEKAIEILRDYRVKYSNYKDFKIGHYDDMEGRYPLALIGIRNETDKEYNTRMKKIQKRKVTEKKEKDEHEAYEREEYLRLKKIFEEK